MANPRICSIDECGKRHYGDGFCHSHYERWKTHGDPLGGRTANGEPLRFLREVVLAYDGNECLPWPYSRISGGYGTVYIDGTDASRSSRNLRGSERKAAYAGA
jgi:hypothetical protein